MSLTMAIITLIAMWLSVAAAMLWGVLRIARRHARLYHNPTANSPKPQSPGRARRHAGAH
ncbi:hypothetical protein [Pseudomonas parafulva]|uniref:hypothetical protein n=1 Tax=Pseudomonas parafulva TaxID=157782 RepID=UPI0009B8F6F5|nr:hypothetical protein [Pseudomonas parafulva]